MSGDPYLIPYGAPAGPESLGDIGLSPEWVFTPGGRFPIGRTSWTVQDLTRVEEKISTAGIVLAVLFVWFCLLGLLFLLMKDRRVVGHVQVTVQGPGLYHATTVPAYQLAAAHHFVNRARSLAAAAS